MIYEDYLIARSHYSNELNGSLGCLDLTGILSNMLYRHVQATLRDTYTIA